MAEHETHSLPGDVTLEEAKQWLRDRWEDGADCPCCGQFAKLYKRPLTSSMAVAMILIARYPGRGYFHVGDWLARWTQTAVIRGGDWAKLRHWGLIENDAAGRSGHYRMTERGRDFVYANLAVPRHVYLYNAQKYDRIDPLRETTTLREALGDKFDLQALMAATPDGSVGNSPI